MLTVIVTAAVGSLIYGAGLTETWTWRQWWKALGIAVLYSRLLDDGFGMLPGSGWVIGPTVLACAAVVWYVEHLRREAAKRRALA